VTSFTNTVINIGSMKTRGFDFEANYRTRLLGNPLGLRLLTTYQPHIIYETPGLQTIDVGGVGFSSNALQASAKIRGTFFVNYKVGDLSVDVSERWRSRLAFTGDPTQIFSSPGCQRDRLHQPQPGLELPSRRRTHGTALLQRPEPVQPPAAADRLPRRERRGRHLRRLCPGRRSDRPLLHGRTADEALARHQTPAAVSKRRGHSSGLVRGTRTPATCRGIE
jgi:hypothetical protein